MIATGYPTLITEIMGGGRAWTIPSQVALRDDDAVYAQCVNLAMDESSRLLIAHGLGLMVPTGSTLLGVRDELKIVASGAGVYMIVAQLAWQESGVWVYSSTNQVVAPVEVPTTEGSMVLGAEDDLWGGVPSLAVARDLTFGLAIQFINSNASARTVGINRHVRELAYTPPEPVSGGSGNYAPILTSPLMVDFDPATEAAEIAQNVRTIMATPLRSSPLYRAFGVSTEALDRPMPAAIQLLEAELIRAIELWEPRVRVTAISWAGSNLDGTLTPTVRLSVISTGQTVTL